jgi:F-type H+-transporting ATPase subunit epsilon
MALYTPFTVTVANVKGALFEGDARLISVPSVDGTAVVLAHHEPLIALLTKGIVKVVDGTGGEHEYTIDSGVLEVSNNKAIVLI